MKFNLDFDIVIGKWVLFSILILVILYGSYYSLFGLREGFESGTCPTGCYGPLEVSGNCKLFNVEKGYNTLNIEAGSLTDNLIIPPGIHTGNDIANVLSAASPFFICTYHDPGNQKVAHYGQFEFKRVDDSSVDPVVIIFPTPQMQRLFGLNTINDDKITLTGTDSVYTTPNLNPPILPKGTKPTEICPFECDANDPKAICAYDKDCANCLPQAICKNGKCPKPSPYPPQSGDGGGGKGDGGDGKGGKGGKGGGDDGGGGGGDGGDETDVLDCKQAKCYEQPSTGTNKQFNRYDPYSKKRGPNDPKYDEDVGFCGIEYMDKSGKKFMFGCSSSKKCANLKCNVACKRDPKTKQLGPNCQPYPKPDSQGGGGDDGDDDDEEDRGDNNSSSNYYDNDMDDYMNELMRPGQMTPNQMYNREAGYGCDTSNSGCCADGFTFKKDASGNNCFDFLPYYNPILFRGGA
jgi:uncharacterized membrane protein YgcG